MWKEVEIVAEVGTSFGIVSDKDGCLVIVVKAPDKALWPHGQEPASGENTIADGYTRYCVEYKEDK